MSHRAAQIVDAVAAAVRTRVESAGVHVYMHRRLSLDPEQDEFPAISVDFGEDEPFDDSTSEIYSTLTVACTVRFVAATEQEVKEGLLAQRREIHRAIMAGATAGLPYSINLGLAFVENVYYGGAEAPDVDVSGELIDGELTSKWRVLYTTTVADPGDDP